MTFACLLHPGRFLWTAAWGSILVGRTLQSLIPESLTKQSAELLQAFLFPLLNPDPPFPCAGQLSVSYSFSRRWSVQMKPGCTDLGIPSSSSPYSPDSCTALCWELLVGREQLLVSRTTPSCSPNFLQVLLRVNASN